MNLLEATRDVQQYLFQYPVERLAAEEARLLAETLHAILRGHNRTPSGCSRFDRQRLRGTGVAFYNGLRFEVSMVSGATGSGTGTVVMVSTKASTAARVMTRRPRSSSWSIG